MTKASKQLDLGLTVTDPEAHRQQQQKMKPRRCLSCPDSFASTGPGNRICGDCKSRKVWTCPTEFAVHAAF